MIKIPDLVRSFWRRRKSSDAPAPIEHRLPVSKLISLPVSTPAHAADFLAVIRSFGVSGTIHSKPLSDVYRMWCRDTDVDPRPWNSVSCELRRQLGGAKTYEWVRDGEGKRHRIRVFRIVPFADANRSVSQLGQPQPKAGGGGSLPC